ncbi:unnamed protein product, partial [Cyprideis torosa]
MFVETIDAGEFIFDHGTSESPVSLESDGYLLHQTFGLTRENWKLLRFQLQRQKLLSGIAQQPEGSAQVLLGGQLILPWPVRLLFHFLLLPPDLFTFSWQSKGVLTWWCRATVQRHQTRFTVTVLAPP